jgi:hypothetical protein
MSDKTPRLALPYLYVAQAQKEVTHNEALQRLDMVVQGVAEDILDAPPPSPTEGQCWLVSPSPTAEWTDHADAIAQWTAGGWRYVDAFAGLHIWMRNTGVNLRHNGISWTADLTAASLRIGGQQVVGPRGPSISAPSGGAVVDTECRAQVSELIAALQAHGLISN